MTLLFDIVPVHCFIDTKYLLYKQLKYSNGPNTYYFTFKGISSVFS
jgi:hypothetical protein